MKKKERLDERTQRALADIKYGDKVRFDDCVEAEVYKDATFRVSSEFPEVVTTKYGVIVFVKLRGLGCFPISKLKRVDEEMRFSDFDVEKGARCCLQENPECTICPYQNTNQDVFGNPMSCRSALDKDVLELLKRKDKFRAERAQKAVR